MNLGMSTNFGPVDLEHIPFPVKLKVDYVRVYQDPDNINYGCDPVDFPTQSYIKQYVHDNSISFTANDVPLTSDTSTLTPTRT